MTEMFHYRSGEFTRGGGFYLPTTTNTVGDAKSRRERDFKRDVELPCRSRSGTGSSMAVAGQRPRER